MIFRFHSAFFLGVGLVALGACHFEPDALVGNPPRDGMPSSGSSSPATEFSIMGELVRTYSVDASDCATPDDLELAIVEWEHPDPAEVRLVFRQLPDAHYAKVAHLFYRPLNVAGPEKQLKCEALAPSVAPHIGLPKALCTMMADTNLSTDAEYVISRLELRNEACPATAIFTVIPTPNDGRSVAGVSYVTAHGAPVPNLKGVSQLGEEK